MPTSPTSTPISDCFDCGEPLGDDLAPVAIYQIDGTQGFQHRSCALRSVIGGIGHLLAHPYWCVERHDPDAGLTRRQSALLVDAWVKVVGLETPLPDWETSSAPSSAEESRTDPEPGSA